MERGEDVDVGKIMAIIQTLEKEQTDFLTMDKVEPAKQEELWVPTYYLPWDANVGPNVAGLGGVIRGGLSIIGAPPGVGKTTLLLRMFVNMAKASKRVAFFSMEMTLSQVALRMLEMEKLPKKVRQRILASEEVCPVQEVYAKAARLAAVYPDLYCIGIDFADLMVEGEQTESMMGDIYKTLAVLAKRTGVPIILISQLSRRYEGGLPRVSHLRYSGMAEATASLVALLYNPDNLWVDMGQTRKDNPLPFSPGKAYIILGKSRYGFKHGGIGAFLVDWKGDMGWGETSLGWYPLGGA
jgi:replicative DNA helicase